MEFFLHPEGKRSPKAEFEILKEKFSEVLPDNDKHAYCRFPARWRWYKKHFPEFKDPALECPKLEAFRKRLSAKSMVMVFSSYYLNNPSSSFGHTFIRLGKDEASVESSRTATELLDTGINYGAVTGDAGPLAYTVGGLAGWFPGTFNAIPYYYKVREYNDYETRDLWSYTLDLTQDEIDFAVDHIWELGHTHFDYYFLTENCSYHMLTILEAAMPRIQLLRHLPGFYTIPSDTLKALEKEGLVKKVTFRAAPSTLFESLIADTTSEEKALVKKLIVSPETKVDLPDERKVKVYDSAIALIDFKHAKAIMKEEEWAQNLKRPLLVDRSKVPLRSAEPDYTSLLPSAPHRGHGSKRLAIGLLNQDSKQGIDLNWRFAFHDVLDYEIAYPYRSKVEVGHIGVRTFGKDVELRDVSLVDIMSLGKWDDFNHASSWRVKLGQWQTRLDHRDYSTQGINGGYGYSYHTKYFAPYAMIAGEASYISEKLNKVKLGTGADAGILFDFTNSLKFNSSVEWRLKPWNESRSLNEFRYSDQNFGVGLYHSNYFTNGEQEFGTRLYLYF